MQRYPNTTYDILYNSVAPVLLHDSPPPLFRGFYLLVLLPSSCIFYSLYTMQLAPPYLSLCSLFYYSLARFVIRISLPNDLQFYISLSSHFVSKYTPLSCRNTLSAYFASTMITSRVTSRR
eukprot:553474_1